MKFKKFDKSKSITHVTIYEKRDGYWDARVPAAWTRPELHKPGLGSIDYVWIKEDSINRVLANSKTVDDDISFGLYS